MKRIDINNLFSKDDRFSACSPTAKLLYLYLINSDSINIVGVFYPINQFTLIEYLGISREELRVATRELVSARLIVIQNYSDDFYIIIKDVYDIQTQSKTTKINIAKELDNCIRPLREYLGKIGIVRPDVPKEVLGKSSIPSAEEVTAYGRSIGYKVDGSKLVDYYTKMSLGVRGGGYWVDKNGNRVKDWKAKVRSVWLRDDNKIEAVNGCPSGFEDFNVDGNYPEKWVNGLPYSSSLALDIVMKRKFKYIQGK